MAPGLCSQLNRLHTNLQSLLWPCSFSLLLVVSLVFLCVHVFIYLLDFSFHFLLNYVSPALNACECVHWTLNEAHSVNGRKKKKKEKKNREDWEEKWKDSVHELTATRGVIT